MIPVAKFNFTKIADIKNVGDMVDVVGIVRDVETLQEVVLKSGEAKHRRNFTIYDDTLRSIQMTLWGKEAADFKKITWRGTGDQGSKSR